jgi:hypothetical protein
MQRWCSRQARALEVEAEGGVDGAARVRGGAIHGGAEMKLPDIEVVSA